MPSIEAVSLYFGAERAASLLIFCVGLVGLELAHTCWRKGITKQARGAAVALVLVACVQLVVGATVFMRSPDDLVRVSEAVDADVVRLKAQEVPRMQTVMRNFRSLWWLELSVLVVAGMGAMAGRRGSWQRGAGMAMVPQSLLMLVFDGLAEQRGAAYLAWLQGL